MSATLPQSHCSTNPWKEHPGKPLHSRSAKEKGEPLGPPGSATVINALNLS